jgi:hypothetical protein
VQPPLFLSRSLPSLCGLKQQRQVRLRRVCLTRNQVG